MHETFDLFIAIQLQRDIAQERLLVHYLCNQKELSEKHFLSRYFGQHGNNACCVQTVAAAATGPSAVSATVEAKPEGEAKATVMASAAVVDASDLVFAIEGGSVAGAALTSGLVISGESNEFSGKIDSKDFEQLRNNESIDNDTTHPVLPAATLNEKIFNDVLMQIWDSNNYAAGSQEDFIYANGSKINHACVSNCMMAFTPAPESYVSIRTKRDLVQGEEITVNYGCEGPFQYRQEKFVKEFKFLCRCNACIDKLNVLRTDHAYRSEHKSFLATETTLTTVLGIETSVEAAESKEIREWAAKIEKYATGEEREVVQFVQILDLRRSSEFETNTILQTSACAKLVRDGLDEILAGR
ncbi:hypothetical protein DID88_007919 [Monilinia fructigena]|uniref:SET domain-containing protein n=1 Tax=Monilinia fructigena TaxID=38457 RepID=A0A395J466_9HELO|nr:hypothetical protein DID88_007919 [Monilinia fructigena]